MADALIGEIRAMAFNYVPPGWLLCDGRTYRVQNYSYLHAVIGTTYGGDDKALTFAVPDLRNCVAVGLGASPKHGLKLGLGEKKGTRAVPLEVKHLPPHRHDLNGKIGEDVNAVNTPQGNWLGIPVYTKTTGNTTVSRRVRRYLKLEKAPDVALHPDTVGYCQVGTPTSHDNSQPVLTMMYCICYEGFMPSRPPVPPPVPPKTGV
ncbi:phage tail protein [Novispirillum itersonii]|uniref:Microcystin-dependent protein n=1 Tax=Novispirillum itersonii TaxID=189 RepID=A0A7X0DLS3_NOVIT|nr:tail fiber protein [Novispirillum itersonii]MBB6210256.1 microcystin-dependent protein [Novispirillum itersonii]